MFWVEITRVITPRIGPLLALAVLITCEPPLGPAEPVSPEDTTSTEIEVRQAIITVSKWHYSVSDPAFAFILLEDRDVDSSSTLVSVAYLDMFRRWINVLWLDVYPLGIFYVSGELTYRRTAGYAVLLYDPNHHLMSRRTRIRYAP
jgi:hypothetical protein